MENDEKSPIVKTPDSSGFWWWRKDDKSPWQLADVDCDVQFKARFYNGSRITDKPWGQWVKADVSAPPAA